MRSLRVSGSRLSDVPSPSLSPSFFTSSYPTYPISFQYGKREGRFKPLKKLKRLDQEEENSFWHSRSTLKLHIHYPSAKNYNYSNIRDVDNQPNRSRQICSTTGVSTFRRTRFV